MSNYQDIYSDLPSRVCEVWHRTKTNTKKDKKIDEKDLSVTAMLMAAAAGLAMPFENLKDVGVGNGMQWKDHPAFSGVDERDYQAALERCDSFFKQPIGSCEGLQGVSIMHCQELSGIRNAVESGQNDRLPDTAHRDVRWVLKVLRNALAHNNLLAFGQSVNQIERLAFFSENRTGAGCKSTVDGWHVLAISVESFEQFLNTWFALLDKDGAYGGAARALAQPPLTQSSH